VEEFSNLRPKVLFSCAYSEVVIHDLYFGNVWVGMRANVFATTDCVENTCCDIVADFQSPAEVATYFIGQLIIAPRSLLSDEDMCVAANVIWPGVQVESGPQSRHTLSGLSGSMDLVL
jgi:hypothetical protein